MIKVVNGFIPFRGFIAVNLFGVLFVRREYKDKLTDRIIGHEKIHTAQMKEMFYIFFYVWYVVEWFVKLFKYGKDAYRNISFEREARDFELSPLRKCFGWVDYI